MNKNRLILFAITILLFAATIITYSNHFNNDFHFDDSHTINNNIYIRDIGNIPRFFTDLKTFGAMPDNLGYRPVVTASTAIDYKIGGGLDPFYFHLSMFVVFLLQAVLMFFVFLKIFDKALKHGWNIFLAFFATALYLLHPGNAETINYISARSDSYSTFFVLLGLFMFMYSRVCRKYWLYTLPVILGVLCKQSAAMFPLLLFVYVFLFEGSPDSERLLSRKNLTVLWKSVVRVLPALIVTFGVSLWVELIVSAQAHSGFLDTRADSLGYHTKYLLTQPYVLFGYFSNFFIPDNLSSDPGMNVFETLKDPALWIGIVFILLMLAVAFITVKNEKFRPISFGIFWFLICSIPTSLLVASTQPANSHRLFYIYVGLTLSVTWFIYLFIIKIAPVFNPVKFVRTVAFLALIVLFAGAGATYQRNEVWKNEETLWGDIVKKNPGNARALMNYGLTLMAKGNYTDAEYNYRKALQIWPYWMYLHINMGIIKEATGLPGEAEQWLLSAIRLGQNSPEGYYYYARFLRNQKRNDQAIANLKTALLVSPAHLESRYMLMDMQAQLEMWEDLAATAQETINIVPGDASATAYLDMAKNKKGSLQNAEDAVKTAPTPEGYLNLSLIYYNKGEYEKCIQACNDALKLNPNYPEAYNNICSAYNAMKKWDEGMRACEQALKLKPDYELARNNLAWAKSEKAKNGGK